MSKRPGRCWCGHVLLTHKSWADGLFCTKAECGCRYYSEKRRGGEVLVSSKPEADSDIPRTVDAINRADAQAEQLLRELVDEVAAWPIGDPGRIHVGAWVRARRWLDERRFGGEE